MCFELLNMMSNENLIANFAGGLLFFINLLQKETNYTK